MSDLIAYKRDNPQSHDIEQALRAYSIEPPIKKRATSASRILGIFRTNYARLDLRVNTHFEPAVENCKFCLHNWALDEVARTYIKPIPRGYHF